MSVLTKDNVFKIEHAYFKHNGVQYDDFTLYYDGHEKVASLALDYYNIDRLREREMSEQCTAKPPKGCSVYLASKMPTPVDAIRKMYNVRLSEEKADYVVIAPLNEPQKYYFREMLIFPNAKVAVCASWDFDTKEIVDFIPSDTDTTNAILTKNFNIFLILKDDKGSYYKYLTGGFTKPVAFYKNLDLDGDDDLTPEVLELTRNIGKAEFNSLEQLSNMDLNLKAIYNYNWRTYKASLGFVLRDMRNPKGGQRYQTVFAEFVHYKSQQGKASREILENCLFNITPSGDKDRERMRALLKEHLAIPDTPAFLSYTDICKKLRNGHISPEEFNNAYNTIVKIS